EIVKPQRCQHVGRGLHSVLNRLAVITNRLFPSGLHLRDDCEAVIRRCPWKDRAVAPLFRFEISLLGERHGRWFRPIGSRCRDGHCALSSRCQLRDLNFVGFDWSTLRFSGRRSAKCQRSCGGGCAQEVTASGFSELIVRHEASPMCLLTLPTYRLSFCREVV